MISTALRPFQKVVVPISTEDWSAAAASAATLLTKPERAVVTLLRVEAPGLGQHEFWDRAEQQLNGVAERLRALHVATVDTCIVQGKPSTEIPAIARQLDADLIMMATRGHHYAERALLGSTTEHVLANSSVPVLVMGPEARITSPVRLVLAAVDASSREWATVAAAREVAHATEARVELVRVLEEDFILGMNADIETRACEGARARLEALARQLEESGVEAHPRLLAGMPTEAIVDMADRLRADLVVVTTRARAGLGRAVLGSCADGLLRQAHQPVLVLRDDMPCLRLPLTAAFRSRRGQPTLAE